MTIATELLSLFNRFDYPSLLLWWTAATGLTFLAYAYLLLRRIPKPRSRLKLASLSLFELFMLGGLVINLSLVGLTAWFAPPNTWDSLTYHMPRVLHWLQNHNLSLYPTNITRQIYLNPWAEYVIAHLQILSGSDRLANFGQWFSMVGAVIGVSLIAKRLGTGVWGQLFACTFVVTLPMGIVQGRKLECTEIGVTMGGDSAEYPLWKFLLQDDQEPLEIEHVAVRNTSVKAYQRTQFDRFKPCAIIAIDLTNHDIRIGDQDFVEVWRSEPITILGTR